MKKFRVLTIAFIALCLALGVSVYFNIELQKPLYELQVFVPTEQDGSTREIINTIDSTKNREAYLFVMNRLEYFDSKIYTGEWNRKVPDLYLTRYIPDWGAVSGVYGLFFEDDISYIISGAEYDGQDIYQFDQQDTADIKFYIEYEE